MYYNAKVQLTYDTDKGPKSKSEVYLVKAESIIDAETIVAQKFKDYPNEWETKSVSASRIVDVYSK